MDSNTHDKAIPIKGRGALSNADSRYVATRLEALDDGWEHQEREPLRTTVTVESTRRIISRNESLDIPFEQSVNTYRGCEHGCIYCYARPTHAYLGLSPGLDFESRLFAKPDAAERLRAELSRKAYVPSPIALGANTDPYQPIERSWRLTREVLEVLQACRHPVSITTKSALVERDIDLLSAMAWDRLAQVQISLATLDRELARRLEPRAASPQRRLDTIRRLAEAGIPVTVLMAPIIPALTDAEIETLLAQAAEAGATGAAYTLLRLPLELNDLFTEWLHTHVPLRAQHVLSRIRDVHGGKIYRSEFGVRHIGSGEYAAMIRQRFQLAAKRLGLGAATMNLDSRQFRPPSIGPIQMELFDPIQNP
jgi:DNA repair photolyase